MADTTFEVGDVVRLKSGGPKMTVTGVGDEYGAPKVWCAWFEMPKGDEKTGSWPPAALQKPEDPKPRRQPYIQAF